MSTTTTAVTIRPSLQRRTLGDQVRKYRYVWLAQRLAPEPDPHKEPQILQSDQPVPVWENVRKGDLISLERYSGISFHKWTVLAVYADHERVSGSAVLSDRFRIAEVESR